jgi:adenine nucleotide transporter 17
VSLVSFLHRLILRKGIRGLYSGLQADTISTLISSFLYFLLYSCLHNAAVRRASRSEPTSYSRDGTMTRGALLGVGQELAVGMVAGVISKGITLPISAVCVRQQLDAKQPTLFGSLRAIHRELGFLGLYSALQPSIPLALLPALTLYIHGTLLLALPTKYQKHPPGVFTFAIGAISNALATIPLYPMI